MRMSHRWTIDITPRPGAWRLPTLISIIVGAAHGASFAPLVSWWTELIALALLVGIVARADTFRIAWLSGYGFGLGWFGTGVYWLYISMHDYGHMPWWAAGSAVLLFCLYLSIYPALAVGLWWRLRARLAPAWQATAFALLWAGSEWLRATVLTGFPWIGTGYAHVDGPLAGYAPIGGVYVVGLLAALVAAALRPGARQRHGFRAPARAAQPAHRGHHGRCGATGARRRNGAASGALDGAGRQTDCGAPVARQCAAGNQIRPRAHGGRVPELFRPDPGPAGRTRGAARKPPSRCRSRTARRAFFDALARRTRAWDMTILSGIFIMEDGPDPNLPLYTNGAIAIGPQTQPPIVDHTKLPVYRKHHLVPFGEFIPWGFHWFVDILQIPIGDQQEGPASQASFPVTRADGSTLLVGMNICYEGLFRRADCARLAAPRCAECADQPDQPRLVRRHHRHSAACARFAHARGSRQAGRCCAPPIQAAPPTSRPTGM